MKTLTKEKLQDWIENGPEKPSDEKPAYTRKDREDFERMVNNLAHALSCLKDSPLINEKGVAFYFNKIANAIVPMKVLGSQALGRIEGAE